MRGALWRVGVLVATVGMGAATGGWAAETVPAPRSEVALPGASGKSLSPAQARARERRRQREGNRRWINVPQMEIDQAAALLGQSGVVIIDVTCREQGAKIPDCIPGAVWRDCTVVEQWAHALEDARIILVYCA